MKFGTETGSLVNHIMSNSVSRSLPEVGTGATVLGWTDRYPATVVWVDDKTKIISVQMDDYKRVDSNGMSEEQDYVFTRNKSNSIHFYKFTKKGWCEVRRNPETNRWNKIGTYGSLVVGRRSAYYDFSF